MKNNDVKRAFDKIKADEEMKSRILENVYKEVNAEKEVKSNKFQLIYLNNRRVMSTLAASMVLVCGVFLYNNQSAGKVEPPSANPISDDRMAQTPTVNENEKIDREFNNFNLVNLKNKTMKIEIRQNDDYSLIKDIENKDFIDSVFKDIENAREKNIKYKNFATKEEEQEANKVFDDVRNSQDKGNSIAMRFVTSDETSGAIRVYLDLNIICINGKYFEVSSDMIGTIRKELNNI
ncbi:MAG: hypothetical protein ACRC3Y_07795 [Romboutsia sp.]|uniref:hypothetical protein n=1 Tax=Romboutsia sp. TaxID=1965302 RepID=UPI003F30CFCA